jgi:hypothetical protein
MGRKNILDQMVTGIPWIQSALNSFKNAILIYKVVSKI